jgi:hypothetical protein
LVLKDVRLGYYTVEQARERFGVVLVPDGSGVDHEATMQLRNRHGKA